jgi:hypothetical protein
MRELAGDLPAIAEKTLHEIPSQVMSFFKLHGIQPMEVSNGTNSTNGVGGVSGDAAGYQYGVENAGEQK